MKTPWRYKPLKWFLDGMSRLPFGVLYAIADVLYFVVYHVAGYRKKVVEKNLAGAFPEKSAAERKAIEKRFYRNFADYIVETVKLNHISDSEMKERMVFEGMEIIDGLMEKGRSISAYFSHCGNWEWAPSVILWSRLKNREQAWFCQVYRPLKNQFFDEYFLHLRGRFGPVSIQKRQTARELIKLRRTGLPAITGFMSDQKPSHGDPIHVIEFLNRPTAVITGTETLSRKLGNALVYWDMHKTGRGHYKIVVRLIAEDASTMPEPYVGTDTYFAMLAETINRQPDIWLWSHKRWKHKVEMPPKPNDNGDERQ